MDNPMTVLLLAVITGTDNSMVVLLLAAIPRERDQFYYGSWPGGR